MTQASVSEANKFSKFERITGEGRGERVRRMNKQRDSAKKKSSAEPVTHLQHRFESALDN